MKPLLLLCHNSPATTSLPRQPYHDNPTTTALPRQPYHDNSTTTVLSQKHCHTSVAEIFFATVVKTIFKQKIIVIHAKSTTFGEYFLYLNNFGFRIIFRKIFLSFIFTDFFLDNSLVLCKEITQLRVNQSL